MRAEAAARRARALAALETSTGVSAEPASKQSVGREAMLADVSPTDGTDFVRQFYAAEIAEYQTTIAVLESYLAVPDNQEVRRFAMVELTGLQIELSDIKSELAAKWPTRVQRRLWFCWAVGLTLPLLSGILSGTDLRCRHGRTRTTSHFRRDCLWPPRRLARTMGLRSLRRGRSSRNQVRSASHCPPQSHCAPSVPPM
ncbi:DUF4142 domain-containing protein [Bradyrhizobium sp. 83012]|uniref:DUF4142 domain-containing protein n=2 Tax=Bradyrhizobium aeschynomenes TaxID=2734909 RepID=A0ABX2C8C2_9BRAD|nr:DUF4142 domain-containing protein [Bradyrhizobium aeschynomenes]NPU63895.1 DUF4142 domain-containing protein [Bradyrhizobium aeschynomenes]